MRRAEKGWTDKSRITDVDNGANYDERGSKKCRYGAASPLGSEQLGLSVGATPDDARTALLRRLPETDFVPPTEWTVALHIFRGRSLDRLPKPARRQELLLMRNRGLTRRSSSLSTSNSGRCTS